MRWKESFILTDQHLKLIRRMTVNYNDICEFGAPEIDPKRPYGNRDVYYDIAKILEIKPKDLEDPEDLRFTEDQAADMLEIHKSTAQALQVILASGSFEPGVYISDPYQRNWRLLKNNLEGKK